MQTCLGVASPYASLGFAQKLASRYVMGDRIKLSALTRFLLDDSYRNLLTLSDVYVEGFGALNVAWKRH